MSIKRLASLAVLLAATACTDALEPRLDEVPQFALNGAVRTEVAFTMTVTEFGDLAWKDLGQSGRGWVRGYHLTFEVEGDVEGTAWMVLNVNFDRNSWLYSGPGLSRVFGTVSVDARDGIWEGSLVGEFLYDPAVDLYNPQLFSRINLHGPDGLKLKAQCDETSAISEVVACEGEILNPGG